MRDVILPIDGGGMFDKRKNEKSVREHAEATAGAAYNANRAQEQIYKKLGQLEKLKWTELNGGAGHTASGTAARRFGWPLRTEIWRQGASMGH